MTYLKIFFACNPSRSATKLPQYNELLWARVYHLSLPGDFNLQIVLCRVQSEPSSTGCSRERPALTACRLESKLLSKTLVSGGSNRATVVIFLHLCVYPPAASCTIRNCLLTFV